MIAIYVRQSVDKKDSLSIEGQIDRCKVEIYDEDYKIYSDKGFSGKNTERPKFIEMMNDVDSEIITKIIVYKIDRISRAIVDFGRIMEKLDKYKVEFVSCSEKFDTSTPIGRAMLNIIMVFAQLERETIQQRVKDNYYQRGEKGYYLGGRAPFGYNKIETTLNGKKTYTFEENEKQSIIVKYLFEEYSTGKVSLGDLVKYLNTQNIKTNFNNDWSSVSVGRLLRNPIYVQANADIYLYLKSKDATLNNDIEEYIGENGCYIYADRKNISTSKFTDLSSSFVTIGLHKGLILSNIWLKCQYKLDDNRQIKNSGKGTHSWLSGLMKCGYCGMAINVVNNNRGYNYINCGGRKLKKCYDRKKVIHLEDIESMVEKYLLNYLKNIKNMTMKEQIENTSELNDLKIQLAQIDEKIDNLLNNLSLGNEVLIQYANKKIEEYDAEKTKINNNILKITSENNKQKYSNTQILDIINDWDTYSISVKKTIAYNFIKEVIITDEEINVIQ